MRWATHPTSDWNETHVTWVRRYVGGTRILRSFTVEELRRRPVTWTIGGLTPAARFFSNVVTTYAAGIQIGLLMCKHFPQVSIPEVLVDQSARSLEHKVTNGKNERPNYWLTSEWSRRRRSLARPWRGSFGTLI